MSFEFFNVDAGDVSRRRARSDDASPTDDSDVAIDPFPRETVPPANEQVAYYHPRGCGANGSDCDDEKIKKICHNNEKDAEAFPIDDVFFGQKIRPPFLKGVYYDEKIDEYGNTHNNDGKVQRTHSGKTIKPGSGVCYNDADDGEDGLRTWTDSEMRDPTNKKDIVFLSKATTARQRVRPMFAEAMTAVRGDFDILSLVGGHHFFRPPVIRTFDEQGWEQSVPDRLLEKAQELAQVCGARPREKNTEEEKVAFEELKRKKFDELYPSSVLNRRSDDDVVVMSLLSKLIDVANATNFTHGEEQMRYRFYENPVTGDRMLDVAGRGEHKLLKKLLDRAEEKTVNEISAELFFEALTVDASTVKTLVAHEKVDVNATINADDDEYNESANETPLHLSMWSFDLESYLALLESPRIEVNKVYGDDENDLKTSLHALVRIDGNDVFDDEQILVLKQMLEALLAHEKVDVNVTIDEDCTPLHDAMKYVNSDHVHDDIVVRMLLDAGANPLATMTNGNTPADEAKRFKNLAIADLLTASIGTRDGIDRRITSSMRKEIDEARANLRRGTVRAWLGSDKEPRAMVFDAKGDRLSVAHARGIVELDADTGLRISRGPKPHNDADPMWKSMDNDLAIETSFSSDGERVALYGELVYQHVHIAQIFRGNTLEAEILIIDGSLVHDNDVSISHVIFSDDETMLAVVYHTGSDPIIDTVKIWKRERNVWNLDPWRTIQTSYPLSTLSVAFAPVGKGRLAIGTGSGIVRVWNLEDEDKTPVEVGDLPTRPATQSTHEIAFSADGERLATLFYEGVFEVRNSTNGGTSWENTRLVFEKRGVSDFAFNPQNSTLLALVVGGNVELWSTIGDVNDDTGGRHLKCFKKARGPLAFSPDGTRLAMVTRRQLIVVENIVEPFAKAFLENEKTRQVVFDSPTRDEILKHARELEIRVVVDDDVLWRLGPHVPNLKRLTFEYLSPDSDIDKLESLKILSLPYVGDPPYLGYEHLPSKVSGIRGLIELDVSGNNLRDLPVDLQNLSSLRHIDVSANHFEAFPDVLKRMPSLRYIRVLSNSTSPFPSDQLSELRDKMNKRLLRIDQTHDIPSELVWGFDGETECDDAHTLTNDDLVEKLKQTSERPSVTHSGTQVLAFLRARYDREYDDDAESVISTHFGEKYMSPRFSRNIGLGVFRLLLVALLMKMKDTNPDPIDSMEFRTMGGEEGVLSDAGRYEFTKWFESDDFERDMRAYATFIARYRWSDDAEDASILGEDRDVPDHEMMGLSKLRDAGFVTT